MTGPKWIIPIEIVRAVASPTGTALITRHALAHGRFFPHAMVELGGAGFVATLYFETYRHGQNREQVISLLATPQENAIGARS